MTEAWFGLLGVVVGAVINGGVGFLANYIRNRRRRRTVARMLLRRIQTAAEQLQWIEFLGTATKHGATIDSGAEDRRALRDFWTRHEESFAEYLDSKDWATVADGIGE